MKTIVVDGVTYKKASELARDFSYTADYLGQLCRARKVDAQLVGRSWYVNPESLAEHRSSRYAELRKQPGRTERPRQPERAEPAARIPVENPLAKRTLRSLSSTKNFYERLDTRPARYTTDDYELVPQLDKPRQSQLLGDPSVATLELDPAGARELSIADESRPAAFVAEPLPEVTLHGRVQVDEVPTEPLVTAVDESEKTANNEENKEISDTRDKLKHDSGDEKAKVNARSKSKSKSKKIGGTGDTFQVSIKKDRAPAHVAKNLGSTATNPMAAPKEEPSALRTPYQPRYRDVAVGHELAVRRLASETPGTYGFARFAPALAVVAGLLAGALLLSVDHVLLVEAGTYTTNVSFNLASLATLF